MNKKLNIVVPIICIIFFIIIATFISIKDNLLIDELGYNFVSSYISEIRTPIVRFITNLGSAKILIPVCSIIMIIFVSFKRNKDAIFLGLCLFLQTLINITIKNIFRRARPSVLVLIKQGGYSFPSGHTMASVSFYGYLIYLVYKEIKNKYIKWTLIILLSVLIFLIGSSRIYLGVHYTSDVLAGFFISIAYLIIFIECTNKIKK